MIAAFLLLTFSISFWPIFIQIPDLLHDLEMFVPGAVGVGLTLYQGHSLKPLWRPTSLRYGMDGLAFPVVVFILYFLITYYSGVHVWGLPEEILAKTNGSYVEAYYRMLRFGVPRLLGWSLLFAMGEEVGWRGYLLRQMRPVIPHFGWRALVMGLIWGIWHMPVMLLMGVPYMQQGIFLINVCLISVGYTWLYERSNSVWPLVMAHGVHNLLLNTLLPTMVLYSPPQYIWWQGETGGVITICYAIVLVVFAWVRSVRWLHH